MSVQANETPRGEAPGWLWSAGVVAFAVVWWLVYGQLIPLTLFVGVNLTIAGLTGFCLMTKLLKAAGAR